MKKDENPTLYFRSNPRKLHVVLGKLNSEQRQAVEDMGFGSILRMNIKKLPNVLGYWLLDRFDHRSRDLELQKGKMIHVTEEDVRRVYGFPNGGRRITQYRSIEPNDLYYEWRAKFGSKKIFLRDIVAEILKCTDGGVWFKRHFLILVCHALIHSHKNGQVFPYIMHCLDNIEEVREWN